MILLFGLICLCKKLRPEKAVFVISHTEVTCSLSEPRAFLREAPVCKKLTRQLVQIRPKILPQHVGAMSWHHAKFHDFQTCFAFTRILKPSFSIVPTERGRLDVWISLPSLAWNLEIHQGHTCDFSNNFGALEHVLVVQIWIMHIKCPETQLMYKKGETSPE